METQPRPLAELAERIVALLAERAPERLVDRGARERCLRLRDHVLGHVLPRARSLDAPLLVLLLGPTGAGKSSLLNALAGRRVSAPGVLRPTTRGLVVVVRPEDRATLTRHGSVLAGVDAGRLAIVEDATAPQGVALVDAPDVDSVEHANRELTDRLAEAADLGIFVTTAGRYADRVPWDVLLRARDRGLPLVVVVNRVPTDPADRAAVLADVDRLLGDFGIDERALTDGGRVDVVAVPEGALGATVDGLDARAVAALAERIDGLGRDRDARRALAARALAGSLAGLAPLVQRVADDAEHEAIEADALRRVAAGAFASELRTVLEDLRRGTFLRAEALRQWQAFVGADEVTRLFSGGIGRIRGTISALVRGTPRAPVAEVREEALADLLALARSHAAEAARRTTADWADEAATRDIVADTPGLWGASEGFDARLSARLDGWVAAIADDVAATGRPKQRLARGATVGVNAAGIGVMLATFAHTGGLTGTEVGVAAATAFLNQKLLGALFGEAAMVELIDRARGRLDEALRASFGEELGRFEGLVPAGAELRALAERLRAAALEADGMASSVPLEARAVMGEAPLDGDAARPDPTDGVAR